MADEPIIRKAYRLTFATDISVSSANVLRMQIANALAKPDFGSLTVQFASDGGDADPSRVLYNFIRLLRLGDLLGGQLRGWFALSALLPSLTAFLCMFWAWPKRFFPFALSFGHFRSRSSSFSRRWLRTNFWERDVLDVELFAAGIGQFLLSKRLRRDAIELILNEVRRSSDFLARLSLSLRLCNWLGKLVVFWTSSTILLPLILIPKVPSSS